MPNHASIQLIGHVGRADEIKFIGQQNTPVLKFSLAVNTGYNDKKTCSWYSCNLFGKQAESLAQYISKGKALHIVGEPTIREWESNGKKGTSVDVRVNVVTLLGGGKDDHGGQQEQAQDVKNTPEQAELLGGSEVPF